MPNTRTPSINSEVAIGRRIKGSEILIGDYLRISVDVERAEKHKSAAPLSRQRPARARSAA